MNKYVIYWNLTNSNIEYKDIINAYTEKEAINILNKTYKCTEVYRVCVL